MIRTAFDWLASWVVVGVIMIPYYVEALLDWLDDVRLNRR